VLRTVSIAGAGAQVVSREDSATEGQGSRRPPRRSPHLSRGRVATLAVLTVIGGFLALQVGREVHANFTITQRAAALRQEIAAVEAGNGDLARQLAYLRSDAYISQEARRIANLGSPDERVLIIPPGAEAALPVALAPRVAPKPMLARWLELFFGEAP
jgi:cell division protein FtsB